MHSVRIGCVRYLNTAPLVEGLDSLREATVIPAVPSRLVGLLTSGEADVALVSLVDAVRSPVPLTLLPVGMIGCDGPTLTVRLYSAVPPERVTRVYADTDSHTSTVLAGLVLRRLHGAAPEIVPFDARERVAPGRGDAEWPHTMLMIGDKVVTDSPPAVRYPHQLDLGECWKRLTGLPFVYAVWACKTEDEMSERVATASALLDRQLRHNLGRLGWIIARRAPEHRWPIDLAERYIAGLLRYQVGPTEQAAAQRFIDEASALGLCPEGRLRWSDARVPA